MAVSSHNKKKKKRAEKKRNDKKYAESQALKVQTTTTELLKQAKQCEILKEQFIALIDKMPKELMGEIKRDEHYINLMESLDKVSTALLNVTQLAKTRNSSTIHEMQTKIAELKAIELTMTTSMYGASRNVDKLLHILKEKRATQATLEDLPEPELIEDGVISDVAVSTNNKMVPMSDEVAEQLQFKRSFPPLPEMEEGLCDNTDLPDVEAFDRLARGIMTNIESYDKIGFMDPAESEEDCEFETPDLEAAQKYGYVDHEHIDDKACEEFEQLDSLDRNEALHVLEALGKEHCHPLEDCDTALTPPSCPE